VLTEGTVKKTELWYS